jgi:lipopolysaccharide transport system permease protein
LGISWALSAIGVFVRDLSHTTAFIATAIMYASAILYSLSRIPQSIAHILLLNPLVSIVDQSRCVLLWNRSISLQSIAYTYIISTSIFILGYIIFKRLRPYFAEVL